MLGEKCLRRNGRFLFPFPALRRTVYIKPKSNNNLIGVITGCSLAWGIALCTVWGFCFIWGSWDRLEVFLSWLPGRVWCWSDLRSRRNNRQCVERKICNPSLQWGRSDTAVSWGFRFVEVVGMVGDCLSLRVGAWRRARCSVAWRTLAPDLK